MLSMQVTGSEMIQEQDKLTDHQTNLPLLSFEVSAWTGAFMHALQYILNISG